MDGEVMSDKKEGLFGALDEIREAQQKAHLEYEAKNDEWWNGLTKEEREDAFYAVMKRLYQGAVVDHRSYRGVLYDVFGFDGGMYSKGMNCGFFSISNILYDGYEMNLLKQVNRFEVIDDTGRAYVKYLKDDERVKYGLQDDDRTLKVFIDNHMWKTDL